MFETSELPESDQHWEMGAEEQDQFGGGGDALSDAIETLHISGPEAFGKFKGKHLDGAKVDFSDRLRPRKQRLG